jgi:hypothetical protein
MKIWSWLLTSFRALLPHQQMQTSAIDVAEIKNRMTGDGLTAREFVELQVRDSVIAWSWVNGSLLDYNTRQFPPTLSKKMQAWLVGMNYGQLMMLKNAGARGIFEHAIGRKMIADVLPVQPLKAVVVRYPPPPKAEPGEPRVVRQRA